ncbi:hypothetical protein [Streptomyces sp. NBC_01244]|uniref:hypothetical protein n=1 Tax=Streptomyces sp. NBC_01244 TaxID=2903797 RepID=UPI002E11BD44|nr:hypothetical protein OG247_43705 [Streptomyces sp. NBC_01244]
MSFSPFGRGADSALPQEGTPAYWRLVTRAGAAFVDAARSGLVNRQAVGTVSALQARYPQGALDLAVTVLADVLVRCPAHQRTKEGLPDLDRLVPARPDALTVLEAASKSNAFFGRGIATAADITGIEEQVRAHDRTLDLVTAAWRVASSAPDLESIRSEIRSSLTPLAADALAVAAALTVATTAAVHLA